MRAALLLFLAALAPASCLGQRALTQEFRLTDGLYRSLDEFMRDAPSLSWKEVDATWAYNDRMRCFQVERITRRGRPEQLLQDSIWGFALRGIPHIRVAPDSCGRPLSLFPELVVRGLINTFAYEREQLESIPMKAYNPLTGTVFRKGNVRRSHTTLERRMFHLGQGELLPLDTRVLEAWMAQEADLVRALNQAPDAMYEEMLLRALVQFNNRHPFIIQSP